MSNAVNPVASWGVVTVHADDDCLLVTSLTPRATFCPKWRQYPPIKLNFGTHFFLHVPFFPDSFLPLPTPSFLFPYLNSVSVPVPSFSSHFTSFSFLFPFPLSFHVLPFLSFSHPLHFYLLLSVPLARLSSLSLLPAPSPVLSHIRRALPSFSFPPGLHCIFFPVSFPLLPLLSPSFSWGGVTMTCCRFAVALGPVLTSHLHVSYAACIMYSLS